MKEVNKKRFISKHAKSSAALISLGIHVVLIVVAVSFVAVTVIQKPETQFEAKPIKRPRMQLKKLQVPVKIKKKKMQAPKLRKRIVVKPSVKSPDIKMPELTGIKGGTGYLNQGGGLGGLGFSMDIPDLFGSNRSFGNELAGTLYDLKLTDRQEPVDMNNELYFEALRRFCSSWDSNRLSNYFQAPRKKFSTVFYIPTLGADAAPRAFGVADIVQPRYWVIHYKGVISAPETGKYRFWGYGDDVMIVRVRKREVLQGNWNDRKAIDWQSEDELNRQYKIFSRKHETLFVGDWISLQKGEEVPIDILVGECGGGQFASALMIEQLGASYETGSDGRPILPIFKTKAIPDKLAQQMQVKQDEATLRGPAFGAVATPRSGVSTGIR